jgi:ArsR family transcriptional regulator, arsenate/arsenite/antimonite-responsive transcriptional repressor
MQHADLNSNINIHGLAALFKALADPIRLRILALIAEGEVCVCHIHESLRLPQPTVSRHLAYLRRAGLVHTRRDGLWVYYALAQPGEPSVRTALSAALHAIGHAQATQRDQRRLERRLPSRPAHARLLPVVSCCGD